MGKMCIRRILSAIAMIVVSVAMPAKAGNAPVPELAGRNINEADVGVWLDATLPKALVQGDIAGGVAVVVRNGKIVTMRGYGLADVATKRPVEPAKTLFRMGSVSKLVTWIAIMQQVELGRLELDQDVNAYLDFRIPPFRGRPITLRDLMTHTAGFEEHMKALFVSGSDRLQPLDRFVKLGLPARVYAPGEVPAYSNYGAALAGYIVQRVSREPFPDYVERHVFGPLGMAASTFRQPLPEGSRLLLSTTFGRASAGAKPFEWVNNGPAGGMTTTGADMAHFMLALLGDGHLGAATILKPSSLAEMERSQDMPARPFETMGLGFIPTNRNGHHVVGHDGDLQYSKTVLYLLPDDDVGLFLALNSAGADHGAWKIRTRLLSDFMDRYFPKTIAAPKAIPTAVADGEAIAGTYGNSRADVSNIFSVRSLLNQDIVTVANDGIVEVPGFETPDGKTEQWVETAPGFWTTQAGDFHMIALREGGRITGLATDQDTTSILLRKRWWQARWFNVPLAYATLAILLLAVVLLPAESVVRRIRAARQPGIRSFADAAMWLTAVAGIACALVFWNLIGRMAHVELLDDRLDGSIHFGQTLAMVTIVGGATFVIAAIAGCAWRGTGIWYRLRTATLVFGCLSAIRFAFLLHLVGWSTQF